MTTPKVTVSTELMKNYKQTLLMSPENKFEALQTNAGNSLLFSIGTDNVFYVTEESTGHATGWEKTDLSSAQIAKSFPGQTGLTCKTFDAGQSVVDGTIGLAMVVNDGANDHLFLCLGNSNSDTSWLNTPGWKQYPFDNPTKNITIAGVFLSETVNNTQFIVVDILRDPSSAEKLISRYYINTQGSPAWQPHDVSIDLEANSYTSCLGRQHLSNSPHQPTIDGLYTSGQVDGNAQLTFQPLYNVFNPKIPAPAARLQLPGGLIADSIASCRKSDMSTDLYACSGGGLYYFASSNQQDGATAVLLSQNGLFDGVRKMYAAQTNNISIVWGLNESDEIFYTSCPVGQETASPSAWSIPLPIVTGVDLFSPYINRVDDGNTFFAVAESTLQKLIKSPTNTIWTSQSITLPSPNTSDTQKYSSYTTRIQVTDENNQPLVNEPISISANSRVGVYINHLYYVIDANGIQINTDQLGSITVVEWISGLTGTKLNVTDSGGNSTAVNPMDKPMGQIAQLNTVDSLKNATITNDDGSTRPLVSSSVSDADLQGAATSNGQLGTVYTKLSSSSSSDTTLHAGGSAALAAPSALTLGGSDTIWVDAGDLFRWLESGVEVVVQIVEDAAKATWNFIAKIAGKTYAAVLDAVEKVVAAAVWVFNAIKTVIEDLILLLEFLFGFQDILVTHRVMKNVFILLVQQSIDSLSSLKTDVTDVFTALQNDVNKWANIPSIDQTTSAISGSNPPPADQNSAPSQLGVHHYQGNASGSSSSYSYSDVGEEIFQDLMNLLNSEETTLFNAYTAIKTDIIDQFNSLSLTQIMQRFVAIVVDSLLETAENILLTVIDVFVQLAQTFLALLTATIDIPVISWLYKELTGDDLSFLDLFCFIAAIPATLVYRAAHSVVPFPKGDSFTDGLLNASSFAEFQSLFFSASSQATPEAENTLVLAESDDAPVLNDARLKVFGFVSGICAFAGAVGLIVVTALQRASEDNPDGFAATFPKTLALLGAIANIAYVAPNISTLINAKSSTWWQQLNNVVTGISILKGFINIPLAALPSGSIGPKISSGVESVINTAWNVPVIMNIIVNKDQVQTTYKSLYVESLANFSFNLGGMMDFLITLTEDEDAKILECAIQYILMGLYGIFIVAAGGINEFAH